MPPSDPPPATGGDDPAGARRERAGSASVDAVADPTSEAGATAVVVVGGDPVSPSVVSTLPSPAFVIAADSGADIAAAIGLDVDLLVGDLDSISPERMAAAARSATTIERHPAAKDKTDLELALDAASALGHRKVIVVGGAGGRLDHLLGNLLLLAAPAYAGLELEARLGGPDEARVLVVHGGGRREVDGVVGELVTLVALGGAARGVTTTGLEYRLIDGDLRPGSTLGVSNRLVRAPATISVRDGVVMVVLPGRERA